MKEESKASWSNSSLPLQPLFLPLPASSYPAEPAPISQVQRAIVYFLCSTSGFFLPRILHFSSPAVVSLLIECPGSAAVLSWARSQSKLLSPLPYSTSGVVQFLCYISYWVVFRIIYLHVWSLASQPLQTLDQSDFRAATSFGPSLTPRSLLE